MTRDTSLALPGACFGGLNLGAIPGWAGTCGSLEPGLQGMKPAVPGGAAGRAEALAAGAGTALQPLKMVPNGAGIPAQGAFPCSEGKHGALRVPHPRGWMPVPGLRDRSAASHGGESPRETRQSAAGARCSRWRERSRLILSPGG